MSKDRTDYAFVAHRIDTRDPQNLGDFSIMRRLPAEDDGYRRTMQYHYNSQTGRLINRGAWSMPVISHGSPIYEGCMKAVERLLGQEAQQ